MLFLLLLSSKYKIAVSRPNGSQIRVTVAVNGQPCTLAVRTMTFAGLGTTRHDPRNTYSPSNQNPTKAVAMVKLTVTIKQKIFIQAKPEQVYNALIIGAEDAAFTGAKATCDPKVGGKFSAWDGYITGTNLKLEKSKRIVQEWKTTEWPAGYVPSTVEFSFTRKNDGTELTLIHSNVPKQQAASYREGWTDFYWKPLKEYFGKRSNSSDQRSGR